MRKTDILGPLASAITVNASASPGVGERTGSGWSTHEVLCDSCGEWVGNCTIRHGYARLTFSCAACHQESVLCFPPATAPASFQGVAGADGVQKMRCVHGHVLGTVEQAPTGVQSYWRRYCPGCRKFRIWPPAREHRLPHTR